MISRVRGEHDSSGRWRLRPADEPARPVAPAVETAELHAGPAGEPETGFDPSVLRDEPMAIDARRTAAWQWVRLLARAVVIVVASSVAYVAVDWVVDQLTPVSARARAQLLPPTPRAWLDAYEAAAIDNPEKVCSQLFSPMLARAYGRAVHGSCTGYFRRIDSSSVTVRRILSEGPTAVLELRQILNHADWAVVLTMQRGGWQAVDLLPGDLLR